METIALWIVTVLAGGFIGHFLPSYLKIKAENLATKEDIGKITNEIESVKTEFEISKSAHVTFINERRNFALKFYDEITKFNYEYLIANFGDIPMDNGQSLFKFQTGFNKTVAEILKTYQRLVVYFEPTSDVLELARVVANNTIDIKKVFAVKFGSVKTTSLDEEIAHKSLLAGGDAPEKLRAAMKSADKANEEYWKEMEHPVQSFQENYGAYTAELNAFLQEEKITKKWPAEAG